MITIGASRTKRHGHTKGLSAGAEIAVPPVLKDDVDYYGKRPELYVRAPSKHSKHGSSTTPALVRSRPTSKGHRVNRNMNQTGAHGSDCNDYLDVKKLELQAEILKSQVKLQKARNESREQDLMMEAAASRHQHSARSARGYHTDHQGPGDSRYNEFDYYTHQGQRPKLLEYHRSPNDVSRTGRAGSPVYYRCDCDDCRRDATASAHRSAASKTSDIPGRGENTISGHRHNDGQRDRHIHFRS